MMQSQWPQHTTRIRVQDNVDFVDYSILINLSSIDKYDNFIFMNSSCIGPVLPTYCCDNWIQSLNKFFQGKVHCIGAVAEVPPDNLGVTCLSEFDFINHSDFSVPFIHTYFFMLDKVGLELLIRENFFLGCVTKDDAIQVRERLMSSIFINHGFDIKVLMRKFHGISLLDKSKWNHKLFSNSGLTCPEIPYNYFGANLNLYEVMFFKNIRHPNSHRGKRNSGISKDNFDYIKNLLLTY